MSLPHLLVTRPIDPHITEDLRAKFRVTCFDDPHPVDPEGLASALPEADYLLSMLTDKVSADMMSQAPNLKMIANLAVGFNNIDIQAAQARGIVVVNTPDVLTSATAELSVGMMIALSRQFRTGDHDVRSGRFAGWGPLDYLGLGLEGATIGILGFGRIGQAVARRLLAFGSKIVYSTRTERPLPADLAACQAVSFDEMVTQSDIVSLHAPLTDENRHLFGPAVFAKMKSHALIINTARGPIVDEEALVAALQAGEIAGAALDVYEREPAIHPGLLDRDDVLLLPHVGSATRATRLRMMAMVRDDLFRHLEGKEPLNRVV